MVLILKIATLTAFYQNDVPTFRKPHYRKTWNFLQEILEVSSRVVQSFVQFSLLEVELFKDKSIRSLYLLPQFLTQCSNGGIAGSSRGMRLKLYHTKWHILTFRCVKFQPSKLRRTRVTAISDPKHFSRSPCIHIVERQLAIDITAAIIHIKKTGASWDASQRRWGPVADVRDY